MSGATAVEFTKWAADAKSRDLATLHYIVTDCRQAAQAMAGWNPGREAYYRDQSMTYGDEIRRRQRAVR